MRQIFKLFISIILSTVFFALANKILYPPPVYAADPYTYTTTFDGDLEGWQNADNPYFGSMTRINFVWSDARDHTGNAGGSALHDYTPSTQKYSNIEVSSFQIWAAIGLTGTGSISSSGIQVTLAAKDETTAAGTARIFFHHTDGTYIQKTFATASSWTVGTRTSDAALNKKLDNISIAYYSYYALDWERYYDDVIIEIPDINIIWITDTCQTVADAHFTGIVSDTWQLSGSATISDSTLTLPPGDTAAQGLTLDGATGYNAVLSVTQVTSAPISLNVFLGTDVDVLTITGTGYYSAFLATPSLLETESISYVLQNNSATGEIGIDYTCLLVSSQSICAAGQNEYLLDIGNNYGTPIIEDAYGVSEGWTGVDYFDGSDTDAVEFNQIPFFIQDLDDELTLSGLIGGQLIYYNPDQVAVVYDYEIIPEVITVTGVYPTGTDPELEVWINGGDGWDVISQTSSFSTTETFNITLWSMEQGIASLSIAVPILQPVRLGLAMTGGGEDGVAFGFDSIEIWGCATGSAASVGECIFGDPDLNADNGEPSPYYWLGGYTPQIEGAAIGPGDVLYQNILPPTAGLYNLEIVADAVGAEGCSFDVRVYRTNSTQLLSSKTILCHVGIAQEYLVGLDLPSDAVEVNIRGVQGQIFVDRLCLTNPFDDMQCLNSNPQFSLGSQYYNGDFTASGGHATLYSGGQMAAIGVDYNAEPAPYILDVTMTSDEADAWVTLGNNPGVYSTDQNYSITGTTTISYTFEAALSGNYGPLIFNDGPESLEVSKYCILNGSGVYTPTTPYDSQPGVYCETVQNPHFDGSTGWDYSNVIIYSSVASFGSSGVISQTITGINAASATVRLLVSAYEDTQATVRLDATTGVTTTTFQEAISVSASNEDIWVQVSFPFTTTYDSVDLIILGDTGFEVDFVCVIYAGSVPAMPPDPDDVPPEIGNPILATCLPPPMGIIPPVTSTTWFQSIWPWASPGPDNIQTVIVYNTAWIRYIGCNFDSFYKWIVDAWDDLIRLLNWMFGLLAFQALLLALDLIFDAVMGLTDLLGGALSSLLSALLGLLPLIGLLLLFVAAIWTFVLIVLGWLWYNIISMGYIPIDFYNAFNTAVGSTAYSDLVTCNDGEFWCGFVAGIQMVNQTIGETIAYPIVIGLIVVVTIVVIWNNLKDLFSIDIR